LVDEPCRRGRDYFRGSVTVHGRLILRGRADASCGGRPNVISPSPMEVSTPVFGSGTATAPSEQPGTQYSDRVGCSVLTVTSNDSQTTPAIEICNPYGRPGDTKAPCCASAISSGEAESNVNAPDTVDPNPMALPSGSCRAKPACVTDRVK